MGIYYIAPIAIALVAISVFASAVFAYMASSAYRRHIDSLCEQRKQT